MEDIVGVADNLYDGIQPINAMRHNADGETCGWYLWAGDTYSEDENFFKPHCFKHIVAKLPIVCKYMSLESGFRFQIDDNGYEDVWFDEKLLLNKTSVVKSVIDDYNSGVRVFKCLDIENESFAGHNLAGIIFEECFIAADFRNTNLQNAQFINGNVKTSDFRGADLTNAKFEQQGLEGTKFTGAKTDGLEFKNNTCYSADNLNTEDFENLFKNEN